MVERLKGDLDEKQFHSRVGTVFHPSYWPAKMLWLQENRKEMVADSAQWMSFGEFLFLEFFGKAHASTSMLSATALEFESAKL